MAAFLGSHIRVGLEILDLERLVVHRIAAEDAEGIVGMGIAGHH